MDKEETIEQKGTVTEAISKTLYKVKLDANGQTIQAHKSNKMKRKRMKIYKGDRIRVEMSYYDTTKGIIPLQKIQKDYEKEILRQKKK